MPISTKRQIHLLRAKIAADLALNRHFELGGSFRRQHLDEAAKRNQAKIEILEGTYTGRVLVAWSPVSERYWHVGCVGTVDRTQIRVGGAWFPLDDRWQVTPLLYET